MKVDNAPSKPTIAENSSEVLSTKEVKKISHCRNSHLNDSTNGSKDAFILSDTVSSTITRDNFAEQYILPLDTNGYTTPQAFIYSGGPSPIPGYIPYHVDPAQYQNPAIDYNFISQPYCVPIPSTVQFSAPVVNDYGYAPEMYQYASPSPYYFETMPTNHLLPSAPSSIPSGGIVIVEQQEPLLPEAMLSNGFISANPYYVGTLPPTYYPLSMDPPPVFNDAGVLPFYPSTVAAAPSISRSRKPKSWLKPGSIPEVVPHLLMSKSQNVEKLLPPVKSDVPKSKITVKNITSRELAPSQLQLTSTASFDPVKVKVNQASERSDFLTNYDDAKFFIIKSYSQDNVNKSIQHGVWASTLNGNKKLDDAFKDAQRRATGNPNGCPVFLFFSVNGSRQFCGLAEMLGPVDCYKTMEFWDQHKWSGSFPVKWHIVKDLPNAMFHRIILENNDNKPVTNSRDTQEINFEQGIEMLYIFKNYPLRSSILHELNLHTPALEDSSNCKPKKSAAQLSERVSELNLKPKEPLKSNSTSEVLGFRSRGDILTPQDRKTGDSFTGQNGINWPDRFSPTSVKSKQMYEDGKTEKALGKKNSRKENSMKPTLVN